MTPHEVNLVVLCRLLRKELVLSGRMDTPLRDQLLDLEAQLTLKGNS